MPDNPLASGSIQGYSCSTLAQLSRLTYLASDTEIGHSYRQVTLVADPGLAKVSM